MTHDTTPVVMKFGGTSVADAPAIARAVAVVAGTRDDSGGPVVVVVSAMSGVTDRLLALAGAAERRAGTHRDADDLWARHVEALTALVAADACAAHLPQIAEHFADLRALLGAASILRSASPAALDAIASTGELASSRIVCAALHAAGVPATWIDAREVIVTDAAHTAAAPDPAATDQAVRRAVAPSLRAGRVAVLGGFVGATSGGVTTTLGRGGSDYSAALVGAALGAREIQIWTDVDGMLTGDPRVIADARIVSRLSFGEASELAYFGAKVLHPSTILPAVARGIPVRILNSRRPGGAGTLITADLPPRDRPLAAVACKRRIATVEITSTRMLMAHGFLRRVFEVFERHATAVDVVTTSEVSVSVTVDDAGRLEAIVDDLGGIAEVAVEQDMAILSAVGDGLRADPRIAARVIGALQEFPVRMVSQAASRRNVTIVLRDADVVAAMQRIHQEFFESDGQSEAGDRRGSACASC
jgi:aspartate kinase